MFDVSFSELIVIGIVALVVIGPERLPGVARTLGHLLGRAQRYVSDVKADIHREIQLDELKKMQSQMTDSVNSIQDSVKKELDSARAAFVSPAQEALATLEAGIKTDNDDADDAQAAKTPEPPSLAEPVQKPPTA